VITLHHLENSRSQRIVWLLEELGVEYEINRYERDKKTGLAPLDLMKVHPLGKAPVITDGELVVAESGAIIEYLVNTYDDGHLLPAKGTPERMDYNYWMHYAEGTFMPLMIVSLIMSRIETAKMPFFVKPIAKGIVAKVRQGYLSPNIKRNLVYMNDVLGKSTWFCGEEISAADIQMSFPLEAAEVRTDLSNSYPNLKAFLDRVKKRPAYQAGLKRGGPYVLLGGK
jgi:glutathione S-transferase